MGVELRKTGRLADNYQRQVKNLQQQKQNSDTANNNLSMALEACNSDLKKSTRKARGFKIGMVTLTPIALISGIWLGSKLGN